MPPRAAATHTFTHPARVNFDPAIHPLTSPDSRRPPRWRKPLPSNPPAESGLQEGSDDRPLRHMKHAERVLRGRRRVAPLAQCLHGVSRRLDQVRPFVTKLLPSLCRPLRLDGSITVETHTFTCAWITRIEHAAAAMSARHSPQHGCFRRRIHLDHCQHNRNSSCAWL